MKLFIPAVKLCTLLIVSNVCAKLLDTSSALLSRHKRFLVYKEGVNWVQMIVGVGIPIEVKDQSITLGTVAKAYYLLPTNSTDYTHPSIDYVRRKRSATRWTIYRLIEVFLTRFGYGDGKACLLRSICEVASMPFEKRTGIMSEIVHAILTPSSTRDTLDSYLDSEYHSAEKLGKKGDNCRRVFPECSANFVQQFSRILV